MAFTYYGDLLGISGYYKLSPEIAKNRLDDFYNVVYQDFHDICVENGTTQVHMLSDSLIVYGEDAIQSLDRLHRVYVKLIHKGLLLRGAIVDKKLNYQIRTELKKFIKQLPDDDTLARAVGLESSKKGARLLVEPELARNILNGCPEWLTVEGYINNQDEHPYSSIEYASVKRRIVPTPEQDGYEFLYFWICPELEHQDVDYNQMIEKLTETKAMLGDTIGMHYKETINLLKRCKARQRFTRKKLGID